jgi:peptide/nickel transport system substrate-binding protein/oligopeptide transport system substrate-binding protein
MILAACSTGDTSGGMQKASTDKQVFVSTLEGIRDIATFDPALVSDTASINPIDMVFTGLVQLDDKLNVKGQLAQSWSQGSDGFTWTFQLRPNLKFSDGTALTAKDVAYSLDRALQPRVKSAAASSYLLIKDADKLSSGKIQTLIGDSIQTPDAHTVVITASTQGAYFLDALTYPTSFVVEKSLIEKYQEKWTEHLNEGGGAGPFVVQHYTSGSQIVFIPNHNYYGPQPQLQKVIMAFYATTDTSYKAYQAGQIDTTDIPAANYAEAKTHTTEFHQVPLLTLRYYAMNYLVKPFDNIHIRQAFALALNKDLIVHAVLKDLDLATNHIVPEGMPGYNAHLTGPDGIQQTSGDATKARLLLKQGMLEEGWTSISQIPPITFTYNAGSQATQDEVVAVMQMWQNVLGITVRLRTVDLNTLGTEIARTRNTANGLQLWRYTWFADYPDAQDWLTLQFDKDSSQNTVNYGQNHNRDAVQQLLKQADVNRDQHARLQQYYQAEQQLVNDVAWLPMYQLESVSLLKPYVQGVVSNALGLTPPDDWSRIYISKH